jgi:hypothetical protein
VWLETTPLYQKDQTLFAINERKFTKTFTNGIVSKTNIFIGGLKNEKIVCVNLYIYMLEQISLSFS